MPVVELVAQLGQVVGQLLARALGVHQQATAWVARIKLQHGAVVGLPVFQQAAHGHVGWGSVLAAQQLGPAGLQGAGGVVVHHHKGDVRVQLGPVVEPVNAAGIGPAPQGLLQVAQQQIERQAVPHRTRLLRGQVVFGHGIGQGCAAMRLAQGVGDLLRQQTVALAGQRGLHARGLQQRLHGGQPRGGVAQQNDFVHAVVLGPLGAQAISWNPSCPSPRP